MSLTSIDNGAFQGNTDLQEIEFKASVGEFGNGCFQNCTSLTSAVLPEGITKINGYTFAGCSSLLSLVVPASVGTISYAAFMNCNSNDFNLIMLPSSAPEIDFGGVSNAGNKFKDFTPYKVTIHNNAYTSYSTDAFWTQYSIHKIPCIKYKTLDKALGKLDPDADFGTPVLAHYYNSTDEYCYLEFAEEPKIGANAFKGFDQLDCLIDMPTGLTSIGASAFEGCTSLRFFQVLETIKEIGADAFKGCTGLNNLTYTGTLADWIDIDFANEYANPMNGMAEGQGKITGNSGDVIPSELTIPSGVETLKAYTFVNANVTSLNLGDVTIIGAGCFKGCTNLTAVTMNKETTSVPADAIDRTQIKTLIYNVPTANYISGDYTKPFTYTQLTKLIIGDAVTSIGYEGFKNCKAMTELTIGNNVTTIGARAFLDCHSLTTVNIPNSVTAIGDQAFSGGKVLESFSGKFASDDHRCLIVNNEIKAFARRGLTTYTIPEGVTKIGNYAFDVCPELRSILILSPTAPTATSTSFDGTSSDLVIYVREKASSGLGTTLGGKTVKQFSNIKYSTGDTGLGWTSLSGYGDDAEFIGDFYDGDDNGTKFGYLEFKGDVTKIPGGSSFKDNNSLTWIDFPNTLEEIGALAFYGCSKLETITIPENVTKIGNSAFNGCSKLETVNFNATNCTETGSASNPVFSVGSGEYNTSIKNINIGENVTNLPDYAFWGCTQVTSLTIPASVTKIGKQCFEYCSQLKTINVLNETPPTLGDKGLHGVNNDCKINVPLNSYLTYTTTDGWSVFKSHTYPQAGEITLQDATAYEIDKTVEGCTIHYTRTVSSDNWMGVYLPFEVDVTDVDGIYATLTGVNGGVLDWTTVETGTIPACTPFIYKPTEFASNEETRDIIFETSDGKLHSCKETSKAFSKDGYTLDGTFTTKTDMASTHAYALSAGNFYYTTDENKILKPYRIFLTVPASVIQTKAPIRNRINGEEVTGIEDVNFDFDIDIDHAHNLHGLRVDESYKGIVIVNCKKVIRK